MSTLALPMNSHASTHRTHPLKSFSEQQLDKNTSWKCTHHSRCSCKMLPMCCSLDKAAQSGAAGRLLPQTI
jgi:hypothetical protein